MQLRKHTLNLRDGDFDFLTSICEPKGVQTSVLIRTIVSNYVDNIKTQIGEENTTPEVDGIEV